MKFASVLFVAVTLAVAVNAQNDRISQGIDEAIALAKDKGARQQALSFLRDAFSQLKSKVGGLRGLSLGPRSGPKAGSGAGSTQAQECPLCKCTADYKPICGSDGVTYSNLCTLQCRQLCDKSLKQSYEGECRAAAATA